MHDVRGVFAGSVRADHSVESIFTALQSMNPDDKLGLLRKAGIMFLPPHIPRFMRRPSNRVKPMITLGYEQESGNKQSLFL